jgi:hypothetical protein
MPISHQRSPTESLEIGFRNRKMAWTTLVCYAEEEEEEGT